MNLLRKTVSGVMLTLLLISTLTLAFNVQSVKTATTIIVPDDYPTIQEAINAAGEGYMIFVKNGVYNENLVVNKAVILVGENRENTLVNGQQIGDVFLITSSNVTIANFKVVNSSYQHSGICLFSVHLCIISDCYITENYFGILLYSSSNNTISRNNITDNWEGILLDSSTENLLYENQLATNMDCGIGLISSGNNTLKNNRLSDNFGIGIWIQSSSSNTLRENSISGGFSNFGVWDPNELLSNFIQDVDTSNIVNGRLIYYWVNKKDQKIPPDAGYVALINSSNIVVENLNLTNNHDGVLFFQTTNSSIINNNITSNSYGIKLCYSSNNTISENMVTSNTYGIRLDSSSNNNLLYRNTIVDNNKLYGILIDSSLNNTVCENTLTNDKSGILIWYYSHYNRVYENNITSNALYGIVVRLYSNGNSVTGNNVINNWCGIRFEDISSDNIIYHNNFINNTKAFDVSESAINIWDNGYPSGGNYWSDYTGVDVKSGPGQDQPGSDGIGDTPYCLIISNSNYVDNYPLKGMFFDFEAMMNYEKYHVEVISNSTVSDLNVGVVLDHWPPYLPFLQVFIEFFTEDTINATTFCRITIPRAILNGTYIVLIDYEEIPAYELPTSNGTHAYLYFAYNQTKQKHEIIIVPEFPPASTLLVLMSATLIITILLKKKRKTKPQLP